MKKQKNFIYWKYIKNHDRKSVSILQNYIVVTNTMTTKVYKLT